MVSIRSLTSPILTHRAKPLAEWRDASSHVVPARPAPLGQPGPARRGRAGRRRAAAVRRRPGAVGAERPVPAALPQRVPARPRRRVGLVVRTGDPVTEVVRAAREVEADRVHVAADFGPYGRARDERVDAALAEHDIELVRTGSPYAVAPGRVTKGDGTPYQVFTPFYRAWTEHGWREPAGDLGPVSWLSGRLRRRTRGAAPRRARRCRPPARRRPSDGGGTTAGSTSRPTTASATGPTSTPPRTCRCTSSGARSTRARCSPT